jgi:hypothetical protein
MRIVAQLLSLGIVLVALTACSTARLCPNCGYYLAEPQMKGSLNVCPRCGIETLHGRGGRSGVPAP